MDDDVPEIQENPPTCLHALHGQSLDSQLPLELRGDALGDGANLSSISTTADQKKITVGNLAFQFEENEILGFFLLCDLCGFVSKLNGGRNGCLQGRMVERRQKKPPLQGILTGFGHSVQA